MTPNLPELRLQAVELARRVHANQVDKSGRPYISHPLHLMDRVVGDAAKIVAVLHDVIEDGGISLEDLAREGYPADVLAALDAISRRPGETYFDFIGRVATSPLAVVVKLEDLLHNMDLSRLPSVSDADRQRQAKYEKAFLRLLGLSGFIESVRNAYLKRLLDSEVSNPIPGFTHLREVK